MIYRRFKYNKRWVSIVLQNAVLINVNIVIALETPITKNMAYFFPLSIEVRFLSTNCIPELLWFFPLLNNLSISSVGKHYTVTFLEKLYKTWAMNFIVLASEGIPKAAVTYFPGAIFSTISFAISFSWSRQYCNICCTFEYIFHGLLWICTLQCKCLELTFPSQTYVFFSLSTRNTSLALRDAALHSTWKWTGFINTSSGSCRSLNTRS